MATPEPQAPTPTLRWAGPVGVAAAVSVAAVALRFRDPHVSGSWGLCPWKLVAGLDCPGCGGLRAVNDLTHGHLVSAASSNLLVVVLLPAAVALWLVWVHRTRTRTPMPTVPGPVWAGGLVVLGLFTVLRNLPAGAWLAS